jgi:hypothetical protein
LLPFDLSPKKTCAIRKRLPSIRYAMS